MNTAYSPLVSVIVPAYNVEGYLDACLVSICQQTYSNMEILVVEDCSTDRSLEVIQQHLSDKRIKLIRHECNRGLSAARNTGIDAAKGDYIMFVDSDDIVDRRLVDVCVKSAVPTGADLVTYGLAPFEDGKPITELQTTEAELTGQVGRLGDEYFQLQHFAWLKFIRANVLHSTGIRFPIGLYYEDWPFHWHLGLVAKHKLQLDAKLYHYRQRGTSITGSTGRKLLDLFTVQRLVIDIVGAQGRRSLQAALEGKIRASHWSVLTRIDDDLLGFALDKAQSVDRAMRSNITSAAASGWRRYLITAVVRLPRPLSLIALRMLRNALQKASPSRRQSLTPSKNS